jgi:drug/metabolite transporter (DMT)-like permease
MSDPPARSIWIALIPAVFVLLWALSFQGTVIALRYIEPFTMLSIRGALNVAIGLAVVLVIGARWPSTWRQAMHIAVAGILLQAVYLSCMINALDQGLPQGTAALIAGLQPLITAIFAGPFLGERLARRQWLGVGLGLVGVALVVSDRVSGNASTLAFLLIAPAPFLITAASLYQKRYCGEMDLWTGLIIQHGAAFIVQLALALTFESMVVQWSWPLIGAIVYMSVFISIGANNMYFYMLKRGAATKAASLFYLTPGVTAVLAWIGFGERLTAGAIIGFAIAALGVALVTRADQPPV